MALAAPDVQKVLGQIILVKWLFLVADACYLQLNNTLGHLYAGHLAHLLAQQALCNRCAYGYLALAHMKTENY